MVTYRDGTSARRRSPIQVLTGPDIGWMLGDMGIPVLGIDGRWSINWWVYRSISIFVACWDSGRRHSTWRPLVIIVVDSSEGVRYVDIDCNIIVTETIWIVYSYEQNRLLSMSRSILLPTALADMKLRLVVSDCSFICQFPALTFEPTHLWPPFLHVHVYGSRVMPIARLFAVNKYDNHLRSRAVCTLDWSWVIRGRKTREWKTRRQTAGLVNAGKGMYGQPNGVLHM